MVMPIVAEMLSSMPVNHKLTNTADTANNGIARMESAMRELSYKNSSRNTSPSASAKTVNL